MTTATTPTTMTTTTKATTSTTTTTVATMTTSSPPRRLPATCPSTHPYAYRHDMNFDFCCATGDDNKGNIGCNANANRTLRCRTCKDNDVFQCPEKPCGDDVMVKTRRLPVTCPSTHPYAYRPDMNFDFCCATGDDNKGNIGCNANANRTLRCRTCKD